MLRHAFYWRTPVGDEEPPLTRYVNAWGRPGDRSLIVFDDYVPVGAAWYRLFTPEDAGFGFIDEMRHGVVPFRELFSPQGPLHLPLLYLANVAGFRTANAPRLLPLAAGVAVTVATYAAGRQIATRRGAVLAALLVTTSGSVLFVTAGIAKYWKVMVVSPLCWPGSTSKIEYP